MKKFANPNFIYIIVFIVPFIVYTLEWSTIYPKITSELFSFYFITFSIAFVTGIIISRLPGFVYRPIPVYKYNGLVVAATLFSYVVDLVYMGFVPLFSFSSGQLNYTREDIGIPGFHLLLVTFNAFFALYIFHQYLSHRKVSMLFQYLALYIPFVFLLQRSSIMYIVIGSGFLFLLSQKRMSMGKIFRLTAIGIIALYLFGVLGNLRSSGGDPLFIPRASGATKEFIESSVPKEFYWGYLYISSPVANLQNNINIEKNVIPDFKSFAVFEMTPNFVSKNLSKALPVTLRHFNQVNAFLNVGSVYVKPFSYLSWKGMYIIFFYIMFLMNLYYLLIRKSYLFGASGIALMCTMISLGTFQNSLVNTQFSFPLFFPFLFSIVRGTGIEAKRKVQERRASRFVNTGIAS